MEINNNISKMIGASIIILLMVSTVAALPSSKETSTEPTYNEDYTHTIFAEFGTATWCPYCKYAHAALKNIYAGEWHPFYYVSLVADKNIHAQTRLSLDYNIYGYPTVYFDGGYRVNVGASSVPGAQSIYNTSIVISGNRQVPDIETNLSVEWLGDATMNIEVSIQNNEASEYDGHIRVYVTEVTSTMGWRDMGGYPYTFAFLDYAFNEDIKINAGDIWQDSTNWDGHEHNDGHGHDFGGITKHNVMVIAAVFNSERHQGHSRPPNQNPFNAYYVDDTTAVGFPIPEPEIGKIKGGFGSISAEIKNTGEDEIPVVEWDISVNGGLLGLINVSTNATIEPLGVDETKTVKTDKLIFGLGTIDVIVTANTISKAAQGLVVGPFILILKSNQ